MSFYGNITNANKSNLIFDKIYPNKQQMISEATSDNVFVGRYVLIEYDDNSHPHLKGYDKVSTLREDTFRGPLYTDTTYTQPFRASTTSANGYTLKINDIVAVDYNPYRVFYKCTNTSGQAQFKREKIITSIEMSSYDYFVNYNIDQKYDEAQHIEFPRSGYDSTIWQKIVEDGTFKYKMIGSLNSELPRFNIELEAPSDYKEKNSITAPYFSSTGTNMDYLLRISPPWGFRVKRADNNTKSDSDLIEENYSVVSGDTIFREEEYRPDIYFNKDGFSLTNRNYENNVSNNISITPNKSGIKYIGSNGEYVFKDDIKELSIHLPGIGNAICKLWDILYGEERNLDINWDSTNGLRLINKNNDSNGYTFTTESVKTIAGCINSIHDLMGMIIVEGQRENIDNFDKDHIYYINGNYYALVENPNFQEIEKSNIQDSDWNYIYVKEDLNGLFNPGAFWTGIKDRDQLPEGVKFYLLNKTNPTKRQLIELKGFSRDLNTVHGLILKLNQLLRIDDYNQEVRDTDTFYGCINTLKDLINRFGELSPKDIIMVDDYGKFSGSTIETDYWITEDRDSSAINGPKLTLTHSDPNSEDEENLTKRGQLGDANQQLQFGDNFTILYAEVDKKGHIAELLEKQMTLPSLDITDNSIEDGQVQKQIITNISRSDNKQGIIVSKENVGNFTLVDYSTAFEEDEKITEEDTVNIAFGKLQGQINSLDFSDTDTTQFISKIIQSDGKISVERHDAGNLLLNSYAIKDGSKIAIKDSINTAFGKLQGQIDALDFSDTDNNTQFISKITQEDGKISVKRDNAGSLVLTGYTVNNEGKLTANDSINTAFGKLQGQIDALDFTDPNTNTTQFISKITQADGKINVERHNAGDLVLTGYSVATAKTAITTTDTINSAFGKVEYRLNILQADSTQEGSVAYQIAQIVAGANEKYDTLKEIADWIVNDKTGAAKMNADILDLKTDVSKLQKQVQTATTGLLDRTTSLENLVGEKTVSAQINEALFANDKAIYALASDLSNSNQRIKNLEDNVDTWNAGEANVQADWNVTDTTSDAYILHKPDLTNMIETTTQFDYTYNETITKLTIEGLMSHIAELEKRLDDLEHPTVSDQQPTGPDSGTTE